MEGQADPRVHTLGLKLQIQSLSETSGSGFGLDYAITYFYNVFGGREISAGDYATVIGLFKEAYKAGSALGVVAPEDPKEILHT